MNNILSLRKKLIISVIVKLILYIGWLPLAIFGGHVGIGIAILLGAFSAIYTFVGIGEGLNIFPFVLKIYQSNEHGAIYYKIKMNSYDISVSLFTNKYIYWDEVRAFSVKHFEYEEDPSVLEKNMEIELGDYVFYENIKKRDMERAITNKKKAIKRLSSNQKINGLEEELKKLEHE